MSEKINNLVCNRCSKSINKLNTDADKWYKRNGKVFCPDCVKLRIISTIEQALRFMPNMKLVTIFHILGISKDCMHISDATYLKELEDKLHHIKSQNK